MISNSCQCSCMYQLVLDFIRYGDSYIDSACHVRAAMDSAIHDGPVAGMTGVDACNPPLLAASRRIGQARARQSTDYRHSCPCSCVKGRHATGVFLLELAGDRPLAPLVRPTGSRGRGESLLIPTVAVQDQDKWHQPRPVLFPGFRVGGRKKKENQLTWMHIVR